MSSIPTPAAEEAVCFNIIVVDEICLGNPWYARSAECLIREITMKQLALLTTFLKSFFTGLCAFLFMTVKCRLAETVSVKYKKFNDSLLTCPTCLNRCDPTEHTSKLLPCSHTICHTCLGRIVGKAPNRKPPNLWCLIYRNSVMIPQGGIGDLPPRFLVNQLLDLMASQHREIIPSVHTINPKSSYFARAVAQFSVQMRYTQTSGKYTRWLCVPSWSCTRPIFHRRKKDVQNYAVQSPAMHAELQRWKLVKRRFYGKLALLIFPSQ